MKLFPSTTLRHVSYLSLKPKKPDSGHCYPLLYFLTAVHVATDITPQVFEAVHLFNGFTFNSYISIVENDTSLFSTKKNYHLLRLT